MKKFIKVIKWFSGLSLLLFAMVAFSKRNLLLGIIVSLISLLAIPLNSEENKKFDLEIKILRSIFGITGLVILFLSFYNFNVLGAVIVGLIIYGILPIEKNLLYITRDKIPFLSNQSYNNEDGLLLDNLKENIKCMQIKCYQIEKSIKKYIESIDQIKANREEVENKIDFYYNQAKEALKENKEDLSKDFLYKKEKMITKYRKYDEIIDNKEKLITIYNKRLNELKEKVDKAKILKREFLLEKENFQIRKEIEGGLNEVAILDDSEYNKIENKRDRLRYEVESSIELSSDDLEVESKELDGISNFQKDILILEKENTKEDELIITKKYVNYFLTSIWAQVGTLYLKSDTLIFKPILKNKRVIIKLDDIIVVDKFNFMCIMPVGMKVMTKDGKEHLYSFWGRNEWVNKLNNFVDL